MILAVPYKNPEDQRRAARAHYERNKEQYLERARTWNNAQKIRIRELIRAEKDKPCADCGRNYPYYVMQFDHLADKKYDVANLVNRLVPIERVRDEIAKCEVVCANCHAERTHQRKQLHLRRPVLSRRPSTATLTRRGCALPPTA